MSNTIEENYSNVVEFLTHSLSAFKCHIDYTENLAGEFKSLFKLGNKLKSDYTTLIKSKAAQGGNETSLSQLAANSDTLIQLLRTKPISSEDIKLAKHHLQKMIIDDPVDKLKTLWNPPKKITTLETLIYSIAAKKTRMLMRSIGVMNVNDRIIVPVVDEEVVDVVEEEMDEERSQLIKELEKEEENKRFECTECSKVYGNEGYLTVHMREQHGVKELQCTVCSMRFKYASSLRVHYRFHVKAHIDKAISSVVTEAGTVRDGCNNPTTGISDVNQNSNNNIIEKKTSKPGTSNSSSNGSPKKCSVCSKQCRNSYFLKLHMRLHHGEVEFNCTICPRKFTLESGLQYHMKLHSLKTGYKTFPCGVCSKVFLQASTLAIHMRVHTKEKPYSCDVCNKRFTQSSGLNLHTRLQHKGVKPFKCEKCDESFTYSGRLFIHMKVHNEQNSPP